jgi:cell division protein FtsX
MHRGARKKGRDTLAETDGVKSTSTTVKSEALRELNRTSGREQIMDYVPLPFHVKLWLPSGAPDFVH